MADYDVEADLPTLLTELGDRGDVVSVRAAEAIVHYRSAWTDTFGSNAEADAHYETLTALGPGHG